ncbi:hypothetical protein EAG_06280 [Camponotus floridanus]|uniref:Uncharacterized protein n=1 Tax=Camponotus floridanus TaxID=104421 RepID=E2A664_CAMFO|nr:hypothetical protein EAG_06280 [Camponotus floridanus]
MPFLMENVKCCGADARSQNGKLHIPDFYHRYSHTFIFIKKNLVFLLSGSQIIFRSTVGDFPDTLYNDLFFLIETKLHCVYPIFFIIPISFTPHKDRAHLYTNDLIHNGRAVTDRHGKTYRTCQSGSELDEPCHSFFKGLNYATVIHPAVRLHCTTKKKDEEQEDVAISVEPYSAKLHIKERNSCGRINSGFPNENIEQIPLSQHLTRLETHRKLVRCLNLSHKDYEGTTIDGTELKVAALNYKSEL